MLSVPCRRHYWLANRRPYMEFVPRLSARPPRAACLPRNSQRDLDVREGHLEKFVSKPHARQRLVDFLLRIVGMPPTNARLAQLLGKPIQLEGDLHSLSRR